MDVFRAAGQIGKVAAHHMKNDIASKFMAVLAFSAFVASASAQIQLYAVREQQAYQQTGDAAINPYYFRFDAQLRTTNPADLSYVTLSGATNGQLNLNQNGNYWSFTSQAYGSLADLQAQYPTATYTLQAGGGIYNQPVQMSVDLAPSWPDVQPMLTGNTFTGLNQWNPTTGDFLMTFNSHQDVPSALYTNTYVTFYDKTTNDGVPISWLLDNDATSLLLDANKFVAGHEYYGYLEFFQQYSKSDEPYFGSIKDRSTSFKFTTSTGNPDDGEITPVPEASTYGLFGAAALAALACHRRRRHRTQS